MKSHISTTLQILAVLLGGLSASEYRLASVPGAEAGVTLAGVPASAIAGGLACVVSLAGAFKFRAQASQSEKDPALDHAASIASICTLSGDAPGLDLISKLCVHLNSKNQP